MEDEEDYAAKIAAVTSDSDSDLPQPVEPNNSEAVPKLPNPGSNATEEDLCQVCYIVYLIPPCILIFRLERPLKDTNDVH